MKRRGLTSFIGDIGISIFAGYGAYYICSLAGISGEVMASLVGVSAHMTTRLVMLFDNRYGVRITKLIRDKEGKDEVKNQ